jgi:ABC-type multidrug transport system, ATPase and permease components
MMLPPWFIFGRSRIQVCFLHLGDLFAFIVLSQSLIAPFSNIGHLWAGLQRSLAAVMRIHEFFQIAKDRAIKQEVEQVPVNVEFRNVSFSYGDDKKALDSVNITIKSGQRIAVIGESGSGKSTLMKHLLGLYPVTEGEIWLLPENREGMKLEGINSYVSYVPQDDFLFDDTIYQNIQYGETDATEEQVYKAAVAANADHFISELPNQYQFQVGE